MDKTFHIPVHRQNTLKERVLHPLRRIPKQEIPAARDVSFTVGEGEFFGIVGRNGSGKSTMLKLLTGIYRPDGGEIEVRGRVSPLIELGVGFNPEMAARDNILINGTLLGLSRPEALARFDRTMEFAGLTEFEDLKLKNYSSGMLMRLAFSIAIHVDADVLLLDEVLAVGDAGFQEKCFEAFRRLKKEGKTIVLVTHAMEAMTRFCQRAMLMEGGRVVEVGEPQEIAEAYRDMVGVNPGEAPSSDPERGRHGDGAADIREVWVEDGSGRRVTGVEQGAPVTICAEIAFKQELVEPLFIFTVRSEDGRHVFNAGTDTDQAEGRTYAAGEAIRVRLDFENHLGVGTYAITPVVAHADRTQWADARKDFAYFNVRGDRWTGAVVDLPHSVEIEREPRP